VARDAPRPVRGHTRGRTARPLLASPALAGPGLNFLRARIAERRDDVSQAATLVTKSLEEMPGHQAYLDFAVKVDAELPSRARAIAAERGRAARYAGMT
jgi:hypothetical protein